MKIKSSNDHDQGKGQGSTARRKQSWKMSHLDIFKLWGNIGKCHIWIFSNYWEILENVTSGYFKIIGKYWKMSHLDIFKLLGNIGKCYIWIF